MEMGEDAQPIKVCDKLKDCLLGDDCIQVDKEIGRGSNSRILEGRYKDSLVAVKEIRPTLADDSDFEFQDSEGRFTRIYLENSYFSHPNVVRCFGLYCPLHARVPYPVIERLDCTLTEYVQLVPAYEFPVNKKLMVISQIAKGLDYFHTRATPIIHGDLSSNNIMLSRWTHCAKINVSSTLRLVNAKRQAEMTKAPGTKDFMPPEVLMDGPKYGTEQDVFSFGCVMLHTLSRQWPTPSEPATGASEAERRQHYFDAIESQAGQFSIDSVQFGVLISIIKCCLATHYKDRPVAKEVLRYFDNMLKDYTVAMTLHRSTFTKVTKELADITSDPPSQCSVVVIGNDIFHWQANINGRYDSPYVGGVFSLDIRFPTDYPLKPPQVKFLTPIFHPNIDGKGKIGTSLLDSDWGPNSTVSKLLLEIQSLLSKPNPRTAVQAGLAKLYSTNRAMFDKTAKEWTCRYAT